MTGKLAEALADAPQIHAALAAVMADCTHVAKRDRNDHQRFLFRGIDAVVNAVGPILRKHSVTVRPVVQSVTYEDVKTSTGKTSTACRVVVDYVFAALDGSEVSATVAAEAWDHGDKAAPKAMSVAFRTALLQTLALPTDEPDPDSHVYERAPQHQAPPPQDVVPPSPITETQSKRMYALLRETGLDKDQTDKDTGEVVPAREVKLKLASYYAGREVKSTSDLTATEASKLIDHLAERVAKAKQAAQAGEPDA